MHVQQNNSKKDYFTSHNEKASSDTQIFDKILTTSVQDGSRNVAIDLLSIAEGKEQTARIREISSGLEYALPLRSPIKGKDLLNNIEDGKLKLAKLSVDNGTILVATQHRLGLLGGGGCLSTPSVQKSSDASSSRSSNYNTITLAHRSGPYMGCKTFREQMRFFEEQEAFVKLQQSDPNKRRR